MRKQPKSIRQSNWNRTTKYLREKINSLHDLYYALPSNASQQTIQSIEAQIADYQNQLTAHLETCPH